VDGPGGIRRATVQVVRTDRMEPPAMNITMIGLDTAKSVFQVTPWIKMARRRSHVSCEGVS